MKRKVTGHIRERRKDVWEVVIEFGDKKDKRERKYFTFYGKKREANDYKRELIQKYVDGHIEPTKMTVAQYLKSWIEKHKRPRKTGRQLAASTAQRYEQILDKHLIPGLGHIPLQDLTAVHIEDHYEATERKDGKKGNISSTTLLQHHRVLRCALASAVRKKLIPFNPCDAVEEVPVVTKKRYVIPTLEQAALILENVKDNLELFVPIYIALTTGLRRGEIFGLKRDGFNLEEGYVDVRWSYSTVESGLKTTKTPESAERVALLPSTIPVLERIFEDQVQQIASCKGVDEGWVCCWKTGEQVHPDYITKHFPLLTEKLKIGHVRFHDLRHTHATWLQDCGIDLKGASDRLRHASIATTGNVYTHLTLDQKKKVATQADATLKLLSHNLWTNPNNSETILQTEP